MDQKSFEIMDQKSLFFDGVKEFSYKEDFFSFHMIKDNKSLFDELLQSLWEKSVKDGYFRYTLRDVETRVLPGNYGFVAQLNIKRAIERRKPQNITDVNMSFNPNLFNFGNVSMHEILFHLNPLHWKKESNSNKEMDFHAIIINVSPLEYCHSLLVPSIKKCNPQILTFDGLRIAVETTLISHDPSFRIGFNSLGAFASVNHLHFHLYYLKHKLAVETLDVKQLAGECYEVTNFPSEGFAFQLTNYEVEPFVRSVMKLVDYLRQKKIAHNVFITRGTSFNYEYHKKDICEKVYNAVRIYVWARTSHFGSKNDIAFNPALCELGGHLPIKNRVYFETVSEDEVASILYCVCHDTFGKIKEKVKYLYEE